VATIVGALAGGAMMTRLGLKRSLWTFGILQGVSGFTFMTLARLGHHYPMMVTAIAVENFCSGLGTAAFSAFIMSLCDKRFTATQYALLTSLMAVSRVIVSAPSGWLAKNIGWETYFLISILIAIPGLILLTRYDKWYKLKAEHEEAAGPLPEPAK
jgi:PAT family beta-lactamase induction signal transducer AmpG